ncbi:MAG TPA: hypothetical protein VFM14_00835 [Gemmatimonadales bacterium]|nr:hypothetical protein [Gemmatimonadales bacterium]
MRPFVKLFGLILGFVLLGAPLVALVWDALNQLVAGHVEGRRVGTGLAGLLLLAILLRLLARAVHRWDGLLEGAAERLRSGTTR